MVTWYKRLNFSSQKQKEKILETEIKFNKMELLCREKPWNIYWLLFKRIKIALSSALVIKT
ncbi:MAG TPA: hypothetical protein VHA30_05080, partial [Patescibacteria group bacterium]|nr:hypothetical protein [Patescibacteria group bacterium]